MTNITDLKYLTELQLLTFYGWWQLSVCLFAFFALIAIWWHIGRKQRDFGQIWLALSVLCWSFSGAVEIYYGQLFMQEGHILQEELNQVLIAKEALPASFKQDFEAFKNWQEEQTYQLNGWRSILSLFNSLFILLALPWFRYIPKRVEPIIKLEYWRWIIGLLFLFSLLPTISKMIFGETIAIISEMDVYFSILTLFFLGNVLWASFEKRRLPILAWLSLVCILITFIAQLYKLAGSNIDLNLLSAIFKTYLIMLFFALALSWVKELAENVIPDSKWLFLSFSTQKDGTKLNYSVSITGIPGKQTETIVLTRALFELLYKFAERKVQTPEGWMEIKPKSVKHAGEHYDIKDHNEIKRLLNALLDGLFGKGNWAKEQHLSPLKSSLFEFSEKRERRIRLSIPASNIDLSL